MTSALNCALTAEIAVAESSTVGERKTVEGEGIQAAHHSHQTSLALPMPGSSLIWKVLPLSSLPSMGRKELVNVSMSPNNWNKSPHLQTNFP